MPDHSGQAAGAPGQVQEESPWVLSTKLVLDYGKKLKITLTSWVKESGRVLDTEFPLIAKGNWNLLPRSDLAICPFNRTHHVSHAELQLHKIVCQDRRVIEQDM